MIALFNRKTLLINSCLVLVYACASYLQLVHSQTPKQKQTDKVIIVGGDSNFPPSTFIQNGEHVGYQVDVIKAISKAVGLKVRFEFSPWKEALEKLSSGEIDLMAMSYSEDRDKVFDFSLQYALNSFGLMVKEGSTIKGIADIKGKKVLVQKGGVMQAYIQKHKIEADYAYLEDVENIIMLLANGPFEAAFLSKKTAFYITNQLKISGLKFVGKEISPRRTAFAVKEGRYELVQLINEGLYIINASGQLNAINEKWFGPIKTEQVDIALVQTWAIRIGIVVFVIISLGAIWNRSLKKEINERKKIEADKNRLIAELQDALDQVNQLKGLIPICAACKKIRDDKGYWNQIESYIEQHSEAQFSHGICMECAEKLYSDSKWYAKKQSKNT